jgi:hypothetical protein
MSKKVMVLAIAVVSAAMLALPALASAAPVIEPGGTSFTGTFGKSVLTATGEPEIICLGENHVTGSFNAGGTGGTISLDYTNCHVEVFLLGTLPCKTSGAPVNNTIALNNLPFDLIYATSAKTKPAVEVTNVSTSIECAGISTVKVTGSVIGTITAPPCGGTSGSATLLFKATGSTQEHMLVNGAGTPVDLKSQTGEGEIKTAGLNTNATITLTGGKTAKLNCL